MTALLVKTDYDGKIYGLSIALSSSPTLEDYRDALHAIEHGLKKLKT